MKFKNLSEVTTEWGLALGIVITSDSGMFALQIWKITIGFEVLY